MGHAAAHAGVGDGRALRPPPPLGRGLRPRAAGPARRAVRVGMVALVPPMWYLQQLRRPDFHESYWRFWLRFFDLPAMAKGLPLRDEWSSGGIIVDPAHT